MGEEMTEMMSQEITRVMDQQSRLEKEYAKLVSLRSELKGLTNKHKLEDVRKEILVSTLVLSTYQSRDYSIKRLDRNLTFGLLDNTENVIIFYRKLLRI